MTTKYFRFLLLTFLLLALLLRVESIEVAPTLFGDQKLVQYDPVRHVYIDRNTWYDNWTLGLPDDHPIRKSMRGEAEYPPVKKTKVTLNKELFLQKKYYICVGAMIITQSQRKARRLVLINVEQMLNEQEGDLQQYRVWPHLGLIFVGTVAEEEGYEVVMWDEYAVGSVPLETLVKPGDIVGLSLVVTGMDRGIVLARKAKELGAKYVIAGNDSAIFRANQVMALPDKPIDAVFTDNGLMAARRFFREIPSVPVDSLDIPGVQITTGGEASSNEEGSLLFELQARKSKGVVKDDVFVVPKLELYPHWETLWANYRATFGHKHSNPETVKNAISLFAQGCTRTRGSKVCRYCTIKGVGDIRVPSMDMMARSVEAYNNFGADMIYNATDSVYEMYKVVKMLQKLGASWKAMTIYGRSQGVARNPHLLDEWQKVATERLLLNIGMDSGSDEMLMKGIEKSSVEGCGSRLEENRKAVRHIRQAGAHLHYSLIFGSPGESVETCESSIEFLEWSIEVLGDQLDICETDIFWLNFGSPASKVFHDYDYAVDLASLAGKTISREDWSKDFALHANEFVTPDCVEEAWYRHFTHIELAEAQAYNKRCAEIMKNHTGSIRGRAFRPA